MDHAPDPDNAPAGASIRVTGTAAAAIDTASPTPGSSALESLPARTLIIAAVGIAALLRIAWAVRHGLTLEQEGVEYTRIGENLLAGRGYIGMFNNGPQLNFPPLYPILIAAASLILPSAAFAARAISIIFGAALVIPAFLIAERVHGRRAAIAVATLVVLHPVLIAGSASTFAEGPYLTLLMGGLFWLIRWATEGRIRDNILAGVSFGLAYLVRPEAFVLVGLFTMLGLAAAFIARDRRSILRGALALPLAFAVVAAPNVVYLTKSTGRLRIEAKGTLAYAWGSRMNSGMSYDEAVKGIGEDLSDQGVFMRPNLDVISSTSYTGREYLAFVLQAVRRNVGPIRRFIVDEMAVGSPFLFALVILGLFGSSWSRQRVLLDGILLLTAGTVLAILGTVQELWFRYFYSVLGFFLIWGGKGVSNLVDWGRATVASLTSNQRVSQLAGGFIAVAALGSVLGLSWRIIPDVSQFQESLWPERTAAGRWLATQSPGHKWVMAGGLQVAYYAGADVMYLPYASSDLAIRYVAKRKPDFIVLHRAPQGGLPYATQWFEKGIPDQRAVLIYDNQLNPPHDRIKIYRWQDHPGSP